jgi:sialate O-acetylesterase
VCFYTFRGVYEALGVPMGLISNSFGGSRIEEWSSPEAIAECPAAAPSPPGETGIFNVMMTPFTLGPMTVRTALWFQGEAQVGNGFSSESPSYYECAIAALIKDWRRKLPSLSTFGSFQLGACAAPCYPGLVNVSDTRQAQQAPLGRIAKFAFASAIDQANFSDPSNIHFPTKQPVSARMAQQLLAIEYGAAAGGQLPLFGGAAQVGGGDPARIVVEVLLTGCGAACALVAATCPVADAAQCAGFAVLVNGSGWARAEPSMLADGRTLALAVDVGAAGPATALATAYGRGNWPLVTLYADGGAGLPVLPWCLTLGLAVNVPCYSAGV